MPDFIIGGAMKSGTSSLHAVLAEHPNVFIPHGEPKLFAIDDWNVREEVFFRGSTGWLAFDWNADRDKLIAWYHGLFKSAEPNQLLGEDSPEYLPSEVAPLRIKEYCPSARLIFLLRDPVDRMWSHYWHLVRGRALWTFEDMLQFDLHRLLVRSVYHSPLERYYDQFPADQILVILFEEFVKYPQETIKRVLHFLDLSAFEAFPHEKLHQNPGRYPRSLKLQLLRNRICRKLATRHWFGYMDGFPSSVDVPRRILLFDRLLQRINPLVPGKKPRMNPETRAFLSPILRRYNEGLDEMLGIDLAEWWPTFRT